MLTAISWYVQTGSDAPALQLAVASSVKISVESRKAPPVYPHVTSSTFNRFWNNKSLQCRLHRIQSQSLRLRMNRLGLQLLILSQKQYFADLLKPTIHHWCQSNVCKNEQQVLLTMTVYLYNLTLFPPDTKLVQAWSDLPLLRGARSSCHPWTLYMDTFSLVFSPPVMTTLSPLTVSGIAQALL